MLERNLKLLNKKKKLRQYYLAQRKMLSQAVFQERNDKIFSHFTDFYSKYKSKVIHTFLGSNELFEVNTEFIIRLLWAKNVKIVVPKIISFFNREDVDDRDDNCGTVEMITATSFIPKKYDAINEKPRMAHYYYQENDVLLRNKYKILEPLSTAKIHNDIKNIEMILCPVLAYDLLGNRLGYGKGYYDEFLSRCNPNSLKVGISFFPPHPKTIVTSKDDIRMSHCINPQGVIKF